MKRTRVQRLQEEFRKEVSDILQHKMKDPRLGFASVTSVEVSNDLRHVKVFVSILGTENERKQTMEALESATGFIRSELGSRISLRHTPEIIFRYDDSIAHGARINKLLQELKEKESANAREGEPDAGGKNED